MSGEETLRVNGVRLWTRTQGAGAPLVLLHGGPGLWDDFDELAPLIEDGALVHRYDQRGCGRSEDARPHHLARFAADLDALRAHWGHESWIVAGHSFGTALALIYALTYPTRVQALIGLASMGINDDWREAYHANANARRTPAQQHRLQELQALREAAGRSWTLEQDHEYCALTWLPDFADPDRALDLARARLRGWSPNYGLNRILTAEWRKRVAGGLELALARVDVPALLIHGARDPRPASAAEHLACALPECHLEVIPGAGHWPWLEQPEAVGRALDGFLRQFTPSPEQAEQDQRAR